MRRAQSAAAAGLCALFMLGGAGAAAAVPEAPAPVEAPAQVPQPGGFAPYFVREPSNVSAAVGEEVTLRSAATAAPRAAYQWEKNGVNGWEAIPGATAYNLTITVREEDGGVYRVVAANGYGSTPSREATLEVKLPPRISTQPADVKAQEGSPAALEIEYYATSAVQVQWEREGENGWEVIPGATSGRYELPALQEVHTGTYRAVLRNEYGETRSEAAELELAVPPQITLQPEDQQVEPGAALTYRSESSGDPEPQIQWERRSKDGVWEEIAGATGETLTVDTTKDGDGVQYRSVHTNSAGSVLSRAVTLDIEMTVAVSGNGEGRGGLSGLVWIGGGILLLAGTGILMSVMLRGGGERSGAHLEELFDRKSVKG